jgi:hypothetical protein
VPLWQFSFRLHRDHDLPCHAVDGAGATDGTDAVFVHGINAAELIEVIVALAVLASSASAQRLGARSPSCSSRWWSPRR